MHCDSKFHREIPLPKITNSSREQLSLYILLNIILVQDSSNPFMHLNALQFHRYRFHFQKLNLLPLIKYNFNIRFAKSIHPSLLHLQIFRVTPLFMRRKDRIHADGFSTTISVKKFRYAQTTTII